jgi:hypothetical protein
MAAIVLYDTGGFSPGKKQTAGLFVHKPDRTGLSCITLSRSQIAPTPFEDS